MVQVGASTIDDERQDESLGRSQAANRVSFAHLAWVMGADFEHLGKHQRAGREPAAHMGVSVVSCWQRHDVSILPAGEVELGRCLGSQPGANLSMMRRRAPQQGQGRGSAQA